MVAKITSRSVHGDIGAPARHPGRFKATVLLLPLALMAIWAASAPFLRDRTAHPTPRALAIGR